MLDTGYSKLKKGKDQKAGRRVKTDLETGGMRKERKKESEKVGR
jgi:hypothetical protein